MKTIVAHNESEEFGGGEIWLCTFLAELQRRGYRVLLLCRNADIAQRASAYSIPTDTFNLGGIAVLTDAVRFARRLRRERADVVLLTTFKKAWLGGMGARLARVPRVYARIGLSTIRARHLVYHWAVRWWLDAVIVNAEEIRERFIREMPDVDPRRVITIYNGVVEPVTDKPINALRDELNLPPDSRVIGTLARLRNQKNLQRLLHALAQLPADVHCIIAGEGPDRDALERVAAELKLRDRVHFVGFRKDVRSVLNALDVFVLPSDWEGLSNSMLQAMAVGVPVVSTRVSGAVSALAPNADGGAPGVIVDFDDTDMARAIQQILDDADLRAQMSTAARSRIRERFSFERMMEQWISVLGL